MCKVGALRVLCACTTLAAQRSFTFAYALTVKDVPAGAHQVDIWLPVPHDDPKERVMQVTVRFDAVRKEHDLEMARAIYNHVVATVKYDKSGKGWGNGDIYYACDARRGNCTDFHAIFIGFPLPADRGAGKIAGYHCWAEFYAAGIGWVPVDASEAARNPARREYFFGAHDENRVELSKGRDVELVPQQQGAALNYFVYPYVEVDGGKYTAVETTYSCADMPAEGPPI